MRPKITPSMKHELADRIHIISDTLQQHVLTHIAMDPKSRVGRKIANAVDLLESSYQDVWGTGLRVEEKEKPWCERGDAPHQDRPTPARPPRKPKPKGKP